MTHYRGLPVLTKEKRLERRAARERARRSTAHGKAYTFAYTRKIKEACLNMYSQGDACCAWCRQADVDVLCIDHINDDGATERKKNRRLGYGMYTWLMSNDYPEGYQVLCANCNLKKEILRKRKSRCVSA